MAGPAPVELSADCDACGLEGGVVEVYDALVAACRFGLPASARCKLCSATWEGVFDRAPGRPLREVPANRCPACLTELSTAAIDERRCSSCGAHAALLEKTSPTRFDDLAALERALGAWAARDGFPSMQALLSATFVTPDTNAILEAIRRGAPIEILADPFANMGVRTTGGGRRKEERGRREAEAPDTVRTGFVHELPSGGACEHAPPPPAAASPPVAPPAAASSPAATSPPAAASPLAAPATPAARSREHEHEHEHQRHASLAQSTPRHVLGDPALANPLAPTDPAAAPLEPPPPSAPPRAIVYPLVSVITADGEVHPEELALVDKFLESEGLARLAEDELRVHHPSDVAHLVPKERREDVVKLMCESAAIDGMPDESERRVIRAYARAWDVDDEKLEFWMWGYESMNTSLARGLWLKLRRFVLSARWSEDEAKD